MSIEGKVMSDDELRNLFVGRIERLTAWQVRDGVLVPHEARFHVNAAEIAFAYMVEVAKEEGIQFVCTR